MNIAQETAIEYLENALTSRLTEIKSVEITPTEYGTYWVDVSTGYIDQDDEFDRKQNWFIQVGKRGGLVAHSYPASVKDMKKFLNITIKKH